MRTKIKQREYRKWPGHIRRRLMALTMRESSGMRCVVQEYNSNPRTFVLFEESTPVAWALIGCDYDIMIYTRRDRRRLGYGRRLFTQAKRWVKSRKKKYHIFNDKENTPFWEKMGEL